MLKSSVITAILARLDAELEVLLRGARASFAAATDPDSKAENKYDTRTLEASYVARGQARRVAELQAARQDFAALNTSLSDSVRAGSLVELAQQGANELYFIGPAEGGLEVSVEGREVMVITPASPLGSRLMGARAEDDVSLPSGRKARLLQVL
jgi:transcription elongation GreA/GreB family factor